MGPAGEVGSATVESEQVGGVCSEPIMLSVSALTTVVGEQYGKDTKDGDKWIAGFGRTQAAVKVSC